MNDSERLVQRFLDQELSPEERVHFIARLGRDEALRRHVIEIEQLALDASRLPRPSVPPGFVESVLNRVVPVRQAAVPAWRRVANALAAPRTLRWNLASAAAALAIVAIAAGMLATLLTRDPARDTTRALTAADPPDPTVLVRLVVVLPDAGTVEVAGDFNGWDPSRTPLTPAAGGAWTVTLPLQPGRYEYMFVVNGQQWIADPFAVEENGDGFGSRNAVLDVRPPTGAV